MKWFAWTGEEVPKIASAKIRWLRRLVLGALALEAWLALRYLPYSESAGEFGIVALAMTACAIAGWQDRWSRFAVPCAFGILLAVVITVFPENANHQFLALIMLALIGLSMLGRDSREVDLDQQLALQSLRWIAVSGLLWAGLMKLLYGVWFEGEFLAFRIAHDESFTLALGWLLPETELARLLSLRPTVGAGPYRVDSAAMIALSNLTWMAEILLPIGLLIRRTRKWALGLGLAFVAAIETGAREFIFGALMIGLLLLFANLRDARPRAALGMTSALRRKFIVAITLVVLIWPIVQASLVARYHVDAWELFGWSMYARPAARVQVLVEAEREGTYSPLRAMGESREEIQRFARRRTALGELAPTHSLAEELFRRDPQLKGLRITTREILLDQESALLVAQDVSHPHRRSDLAPTAPGQSDK